MRGRVRLHSGGISPSEVRLTRRGASERGTAPGKDIRDFRPDRARRCVYCGAEALASGRYCGPCERDRTIVRECKALLREAGLPPLGTVVSVGSPYSKKRRSAVEAQRRLDQRAKRSGRPVPRIPTPRASSHGVTRRTILAKPKTHGSNASKAKATKAQPGRTWSVHSVKSSSVCPECFTERSSAGTCAC